MTFKEWLFSMAEKPLIDNPVINGRWGLLHIITMIICVAVILAISTTLTFIGTIYFVFNTTQFAFITYNLIFASAAQLIKTITTINMYKISQERTVSILYRTEYIALREIGINIGRMIGYGLVIFAALSQNPQMLKYLILFISIVIAAMGYMSVILSNWINSKEPIKC
jgi:phosphoglycerol transferase MdoB-like AlkP superfamily enzyme